MVSLATFRIELDRTPPLFAPGNNITGRLFLLNGRKIDIDKLSIELKGRAYVDLNNSNSSRNDMRSEDIFVNSRQVILDKQTATSGVFLDAGEHVYPFDICLPNRRLPTSLEHFSGHIRYWVQGVIEIPWSYKSCYTNYTYKMFTVLNIYDLNSKPSLNLPIGVNERIAASCCSPCQPRQQVHVTLDVKKTGFVCGEKIEFSVSISNQSDRTIDSFKVQLIQKIRLVATKRCSSVFAEQIAMMELHECQVLPKTQKHFNDLKLPVPVTCPSLQNTCFIITNKYILKVVVDTPGLGHSKDVKISIEIGTVPIVAENERESVLDRVTFDREAWEGNNSDGRSQPTGVSSFKPLYPIFFPES